MYKLIINFPIFFYKTLGGNKLFFKDDPCKILKSQKNKIEISQSKSAHLYDGIALVKVLLLVRRKL